MGSSNAGGPLLPNAGIGPDDNNIPWNVAVPVGILLFVLSAYIVKLKRV